MRQAEHLPPFGAQVKNKQPIHPLSYLPSLREWRRSYLYVGNQLPDYMVSHLRHQYNVNKNILHNILFRLRTDMFYQMVVEWMTEKLERSINERTVFQALCLSGYRSMLKATNFHP